MARRTDMEQQASARGENTLLPVVRSAPGGFPLWVFALGLAGVAILLFIMLESRRQAATVASVRPRQADQSVAAQGVPPLFIPGEPFIETEPVQLVAEPQPSLPPPPRRVAPPPPPVAYYPPPPMPMNPPVDPNPAPAASAGSSDSALVYDGTSGESGVPASGEGAAGGEGGSVAPSTRARATMIRRRSTTVLQGTLIAAVLETALDSTRGGLSRALVTRDVYGFDGRKLLIPRGSRLIGEYRGELQPGQNRALITWTRLIRPDGVSIALGSPSADPLGRIGVKGKVDSHFFARFSGALLQSTLDVGVALAARAGNSPVVVALPGAVQNSAGQGGSGNQVTPTLKVKQGTSIAVFVARDLDFTSVETRR